MKKHVFLLLMAFVVCHGLNAQNTGEQRLFNLVLPDNTVVSYELADGVDIHFEDSIMVVNDLSFYMEDIVKYYFTGVGNDGTQQISLFESGWNWWSCCVELNGNSLTQLQDDLGSSGLTIKSQNDGFNSYLEGLGWYGTLNTINNESMYQVRMNENYFSLVTFTGLAANPVFHPISLNPGWTWIGYPVNASMSVEDAFSGITPTTGDMVKSQDDGFASYLEGLGWYGALNTLAPGMGLMYKSNNGSAITLVCPNSGTRTDLEANQTTASNHWQPNLNAYADNMSVMAVVEVDGIELEGGNYELAAFADGECRGSAKLMYVEPLNRCMAFMTIAGDEATELCFKLYNAETGTVVETVYTPSLQYETNAIVGSLTEPYVVRFDGTTGVAEASDSHIVGSKLYVKSPNKGSVVVSDVLGRVVFSQQTNGACVIDLDMLAPNTLYIIKVNNQTLKFIRR